MEDKPSFSQDIMDKEERISSAKGGLHRNTKKLYKIKKPSGDPKESRRSWGKKNLKQMQQQRQKFPQSHQDLFVKIQQDITLSDYSGLQNVTQKH